MRTNEGRINVFQQQRDSGELARINYTKRRLTAQLHVTSHSLFVNGGRLQIILLLWGRRQVGRLRRPDDGWRQVGQNVP